MQIGMMGLLLWDLEQAFRGVVGGLVFCGCCIFGRGNCTFERHPLQKAQEHHDILMCPVQATVLDVVPSRSCGSVEWHGACPSSGTFRVRLEGPATLWGKSISRWSYEQFRIFGVQQQVPAPWRI